MTHFNDYILVALSEGLLWLACIDDLPSICGKRMSEDKSEAGDTPSVIRIWC
jgi:hypothetical protein